MQFAKNGPDIPDRMLQEHEDGRIVFFCGSGISSPAGLPGFAKLVDKVYDSLDIQCSSLEQSAIKSKHFDRAIDLLERRIVDGRARVRNCLSQILVPNLNLPKATATHEALLTLSQNREDCIRIVTTNFDQLFEKVIAKKQLAVEHFKAPLLPLPKKRWNGLVYLHGLLPDNPSDRELNRLVLSSGDFGLAYLSERWAARFVSELFRNYSVCFVGYSMDDPVLRYMMDALAADLLLGETPNEMFAFCSYSKGNRDQCKNEWIAKNVTPILYRDCRNYWYLHETLRNWAGIYRDGVSGKESIVAKYAGLIPTVSTKQDDFVGKMMWALKDASGLPAKRLADFDPVPSLDWLAPFCDDRYRQDDLRQFGVSPNAEQNDKLQFSILRRPSPYTLPPWMALFEENANMIRWDKVMDHLARWLTRHLDDLNLILWLTKHDEPVHHTFATMIENQLEKLDELEHDGNLEELSRIRENAPNAIPRAEMRTLWHLLLAGRIRSCSMFDIYHWINCFQRDGLTLILRLKLRDALAPRILIRRPFLLNEAEEIPDEQKKPKHLVDAKIVLSFDSVFSAVYKLRQLPCWSNVLPDLLHDFSALLMDAMDLAREIGEAEDGNDLSWLAQPSIDDHPQNMRFFDWTALIELSRDAWLATARTAPERAEIILKTWRAAPYPVFRRLVFFAAAISQNEQNDISCLDQPRQVLDWLLEDEHRWLWSNQTEREKMRLVIALSPRLDFESLIRLELAVLEGPPRTMFKAEITPERWNQFVDSSIFQLLIRMDSAGAVLGESARDKLDELTFQHPDWNLEPQESDEFSWWMGDGDELIQFLTTPSSLSDLIEWLKRHPEVGVPEKDDWVRRCREDFDTTANALCTLAEENIWPVCRWREALYAWSDENLISCSGNKMIPMLAKMPDDDLQSLTSSIGPWLTAVSKTSDLEDEIFFDLCIRLLNFNYQNDLGVHINDPVPQAKKHPVGYVTDALLNLWFRNPLEDGEGLPDKLRPIVTRLCNTESDKFRHGRVILAFHVVTLFRVDREWTKSNLLPLFDWSNNEGDALAVWTGFLWSPRLYLPLIEAIKVPFLDTVSYYRTLGRYGVQYVSLLTFAAVELGNTFTKQQLADATEMLPEKGLLTAASTLGRTLNSAGEQRIEYWRNRVLPYLKSVWPRSVENKNPAISKRLSELCINAGDAFPEALEELKCWLLQLPNSGHLISRLKHSGLCNKFPEPALTFLYLLTGEPPLGNDLRDCLKNISSVEPRLKDDARFIELRNIFLSGGGIWE